MLKTLHDAIAVVEAMTESAGCEICTHYERGYCDQWQTDVPSSARAEGCDRWDDLIPF